MLEGVTFLSAFLVGLLGGVHCVGMCGGIVGALSFTLPESIRIDPRRIFPYLLAYNGGRFLSYTVAGALFGGIGALAMHLADVRSAQLVLRIVAGLFMVALGLYLGGWWLGLVRIEQAGSVIWQRLEPIGRRFLPVRTKGQAFALGLIWGWLPCGLVYSVLIWAISAGSALKGGLLLASFAAGTLPNLLAMGLFSMWLATQARKPWVRHIVGALVTSFGVYTLINAL